MKNYALIVLLIIATVLVAANKLAKGNYGAQTLNPQFQVSSIPEVGLTLITPANPQFDKLMASRLKEAGPILKSLRPFSVLISNTNGRTVVAYSLKWDLTREDGRVATETRSYITLWKLMGLQASDYDGGIIPSGSFALATPSNLDFSQAETQKGSDPAFLAYANATRTELMNYTKIAVTLDGAFFDDGSYVGPDTTGFFTRVEMLRNAKRDLYAEVAESLNRGTPTNEFLKGLESLASNSRIGSSTPLTAAELYVKYKAAAAKELLQMGAGPGNTKVLEFVSDQLKNPWPDLKKQ